VSGPRLVILAGVMTDSASAAYLRQTVMLSPYETPEIRQLYNKSLKNVAGKMRTEHTWSPLAVPEGIDQVCSSLLISAAFSTSMHYRNLCGSSVQTRRTNWRSGSSTLPNRLAAYVVG
jgi:hypothetical protein